MNKIFFLLFVLLLNVPSVSLLGDTELQRLDNNAHDLVAGSKDTPAGALQQAILQHAGLDITEPEAVHQNSLLKISKASRQVPKAEDLHLHRLLTQVSIYLKSTIDELVEDGAHAAELKPILAASILCVQSLEGIGRIMELFQAAALDDSFQFERYFVNLCNALQEHGMAVKPRHLREFYQRLKKFENLVFRYFYKQKEFMSNVEKELFSQMNLLCYRLRFCLLREEYFDFSFLDQLADISFFRPIEWVADHKILSASLLVAAGLVYYFYLHPRLYPPNPVVTPIEGCFKQRSAAECCMYAIANAIALQQPNKDAIFHRTPPFNMGALLQETRAELAADPDRLARLPETTSWLNGDQAINVLHEPAFMRRLCQHMGVAFNAADPSQGVRMVQGNEFNQSEITYPELLAVQDGLRAGRAQATVCFQGDSNHQGRGHWLAARMVPVATTAAVRVEVADSLSSMFRPFSDITWSQSLLDARSMFVQGVMPEDVTNALKAVRSADVFYTGNLRDATRQEIANRSFTRYALAVEQVNAAGGQMLANPASLAYVDCKNMFEELRRRAMTDRGRNNLDPVVIGIANGPDVHPELLDLNQVQTFDAFKHWLFGE